MTSAETWAPRRAAFAAFVEAFAVGRGRAPTIAEAARGLGINRVAARRWFARTGIEPSLGKHARGVELAGDRDGTAAGDVLRWLARHGPADRRRIAEATGRGGEAVFLALRKLLRRRRVMVAGLAPIPGDATGRGWVKLWGVVPTHSEKIS